MKSNLFGHMGWSLALPILTLSLIHPIDVGSVWGDEPKASRESRVKFSTFADGESRWKDGFWFEKQQVCRESSIPQMWTILSDDVHTQFLSNFLIAAGDREGRHRGPSWNDGDFYKWIEAASSIYLMYPDPNLKRSLDTALKAIERAQRSDGYLHTPNLIRLRQGDAKAIPFSEPLQFELYNFGHLMTAACAHHRATGESGLIEVAVKAADFLDRTFHSDSSPIGRSAICPAHYMGLIELGRYRNEARYIQLARMLIERRDAVIDGTDDNQDRIPLRKQTKITGHAVRANYLYAGVADLLQETSDRDLMTTLEMLWEDLRTRKLYVTGACGALYDGASPDGTPEQKIISRTHQAYGRDYQLPNSTAHNESCATIGNLLWNWRMMELSGDAKYAEVLELAMYNGLLATVSLDGSSYFYTNTLRQLNQMPAELRWSRNRQPFISCYCCPPNIVRTIAQSQNYAYGKSADGVWVHLYGTSRLETKHLGGEMLVLEQQTKYPWNGSIQLQVFEAPQTPWKLRLRIPEWAEDAKLILNGRDMASETLPLRPGAYSTLDRVWQKNDLLELELPMKVRFLESHPLVEETRNHWAVARGPIVYCLESADLPLGTPLLDVYLSQQENFSPKMESNPVSYGTLHGRGYVRKADVWKTQLYRKSNGTEFRPIDLRLIPYFAWGNRGPSEMTVWIPARHFP